MRHGNLRPAPADRVPEPQRVLACAPASGAYKTDLADGLIRVGGTIDDPFTDVTCTARGDKTGGTYRTSVADLMRWVAESVVGLTTPEIDTAAVATLNTANAAGIGLWLPSGGRADAVMDQLADAIGAFWTFDRTADERLVLGRFEAPATGADFALEERAFVLDSLQLIGTDSPRWRQAVRHDRNWTVQTSGDLVAGATFYTRDFLAEEWRRSVAEDAAIKTDFPDADEDEIDSVIKAKADADAEAARRLTLYGSRRDRFRGNVKSQAFQLKIGDQGTITHGGFADFTSGGVARLIGLEENARTNDATIEVWR